MNLLPLLFKLGALTAVLFILASFGVWLLLWSWSWCFGDDDDAGFAREELLTDAVTDDAWGVFLAAHGLKSCRRPVVWVHRIRASLTEVDQ